MESIWNTPHIKVNFYSKDLPTIISFSDNQPIGKFKPYRLLNKGYFNVIFVSDIGPRWYQGGIDQISSDPKEAAQILVDFARKLGNGKVVTFGASMGGFASILFGNLGKADGCITFGPQTSLALKTGWAERHLPEIKETYPDLRMILTDNKTPMYLFIVEHDPIDLISGLHIKGFPNINLISIRNGLHSGLQIFDEELLNKFLLELASEGRLNIDFNDQLYGDIFEDEELIQQLYEAHLIKKLSKDKQKWLEFVKDISEKWVNNPIVLETLGEALNENKKKKEAERVFRKAIELSPYSFRAHEKISKMHRSRKEYDLAIEEIKNAIKINPAIPYFYNTLGIIQRDTEQYDSAIENFKIAIKLGKKSNQMRFEMNLAKALVDSSIQKMNEAKILFNKHSVDKDPLK